MDRALLEQNLVEVEQHITLGLHHIARQVKIIAMLQRRGHADAATVASQLLGTFEGMQVEHETHRDRLLRKLQPPT
jgi:hypothetical protein